jgi:hypothetical protein
MTFRTTLLPVALVLAACSTPAPSQPTSSPSPGASTKTSATPSTAASATAPAAASAFKGTVKVSRDGVPLKVGPQFNDNDYGYQRDFTFGAYTVEETKAMGADEAGIVWSDGNLADNSSLIKLRLNVKDHILEVQGVPGKGGTDLQPGQCTKEMSEDKKTLVKYTYEGKMLDTNNGRKPTAESYSVEITNLSVARK